jgi:hypothetical protein
MRNEISQIKKERIIEVMKKGFIFAFRLRIYTVEA